MIDNEPKNADVYTDFLPLYSVKEGEEPIFQGAPKLIARRPTENLLILQQ